MSKKVFTSYSWDNEDHRSAVISFVNYLRENGFHADMDSSLSQSQTSIDFEKMMHKAVTDYEKVIIVLSVGYKKKAEEFKGGVGSEYLMILKDIEKNERKYVLVSFDDISNDIIPLSLQGREIVNLQKPENLNVLFAKLLDENLIDYSSVGTTTPIITKRTIPDFQNLIKKK